MTRKKRTTTLKLWAYRHSMTHGWRWAIERTVDAGVHASLAVDVARQSEPQVSFLISKTKPLVSP